MNRDKSILKDWHRIPLELLFKFYLILNQLLKFFITCFSFFTIYAKKKSFFRGHGWSFSTPLQNSKNPDFYISKGVLVQGMSLRLVCFQINVQFTVLRISCFKLFGLLSEYLDLVFF
jgi:hypothetical protein